MKIDKKIFDIKYTKGTGAGGQHKNKVETCVTITHIPSGMSEKCEDTRYKRQNEKIAYERLLIKLKNIVREKRKEKFNDQRNKAISEAGRIRTYNESRNQVKDHRTGKTAKYKDVLDGGIDKLW